MPKQASNGELRMMAWTKAIVAILLVLIVGYSVVAGVEIEDYLVQLVFLILGGYFGLSAKVYRDSSKR